MKNLKIFQNSKGATTAEYSIIAAVLILIAILAFTNLGDKIFEHVSNLAAGF